MFPLAGGVLVSLCLLFGVCCPPGCLLCGVSSLFCVSQAEKVFSLHSKRGEKIRTEVDLAQRELAGFPSETPDGLNSRRVEVPEEHFIDRAPEKRNLSAAS